MSNVQIVGAQEYGKKLMTNFVVSVLFLKIYLKISKLFDRNDEYRVLVSLHIWLAI